MYAWKWGKSEMEDETIVLLMAYVLGGAATWCFV
jgi:hypothetical protein